MTIPTSKPVRIPTRPEPPIGRSHCPPTTPLRATPEGVLGPEHPDTLNARDGLARWTGEAGDPAVFYQDGSGS